LQSRVPCYGLAAVLYGVLRSYRMGAVALPPRGRSLRVEALLVHRQRAVAHDDPRAFEWSAPLRTLRQDSPLVIPAK